MGNQITLSLIKGLNRSLTIFTKKKTMGLDSLACEFYQVFKKEMIAFLYNLFQKNRSRGNTS